MNLVEWLEVDLFDLGKAISDPYYEDDYMEDFYFTNYEASVRSEEGCYGKF